MTEFVESTWYLYRATRDPFYLDVGERILLDITTRSRVDCGLAGISDLRTNKLDDRMESFALSETLKVCGAATCVAHESDSLFIVSLPPFRRVQSTS